MPCLAAFVNQEDYNLHLIDEYNQKITGYTGYDLVAITINTPNARHCYDLARRFRAGGAKVVLGGPGHPAKLQRP